MLRYFKIKGQYVLKYLQTVPKHAKMVENGGTTCADQITYYKSNLKLANKPFNIQKYSL